ncbi:MAG: SWIB/MDM2 domain-containing protein [Acetobacteraceae bacterium]
MVTASSRKRYGEDGGNAIPCKTGEKPMPTKTPEKKTPAKAKPVAKAAVGGAKTNALQKPLQPSAELAAVVGAGPVSRGQVVSKVWDYIRTNNLQNPADRREILADEKLKKVFDKDKVTMFEMNKHLARHLK